MDALALLADALTLGVAGAAVWLATRRLRAGQVDDDGRGTELRVVARHKHRWPAEPSEIDGDTGVFTCACGDRQFRQRVGGKWLPG